jgi:hypothetical protein
MTDIDVSKIPADVMAIAAKYVITGDDERINERQEIQIALAILQERAACAQHAFAMRWAPPLELQGTKEADEISKLTTSWSHQVGMGILNR